MSFWGDVHRRSRGDEVRKEDGWIFTNESALETSIIKPIEDLLGDVFSRFHANARLSGLSGCGNRVTVSDIEKTYYDLFKERNHLPDKKGEQGRIQKIRVLGEYCNGGIILYIKNIKAAAGKAGKNAPSYLAVTRYVYLHELMHAFFDRFDRTEKEKYEYNPEQEEGLAEFGALFLLDQLIREGGAKESELEWAVRHVEQKKGVLECYSRGAYLFKLFGHDINISKAMLEAYPKQSNK